MPLPHALSFTPLHFSLDSYPSSAKQLIIFPKLPLNAGKITLHDIPRCHSPRRSVSSRATEQDILDAMAKSDGSESTVPAVRAYENNSARLTLVGASDFQQALTAAAADGGRAADEHISAGMPAMVVETVFPGSSDQNSTISSRLFLPARKVKEKARRLQKSLKDNILPGTQSENILAMTFRQVIIQKLWNFELVLFIPGAERNMDDLKNPRDVPPSFALSSSDGRVISVIAEVMCLAALEITGTNSLHKSLGRSSKHFSNWFGKPKKIVSRDSSIVLHNLLEDEVATNKKGLLNYFLSERSRFKYVKLKPKNTWWKTPVQSKLEQIGGPEFAAWFSEHVPSFRLQVDADKFDEVKFEGWNKLTANRWEVLLTHSQMVGLTSILDMYFEDSFTLPNKQLSCGGVVRAPKMLLNKSGTWLKTLMISITSGILLATITVMSQIYLPCLTMGRKILPGKQTLQSSDASCIPYQSAEATELEAYCVSVVRRVKDAFSWHGQITADAGPRAWTGELPFYLREMSQACSSSVDNLSTSEICQEDVKSSAQEIASFQVVLSADGKIVGFQPTNRVAVNQWAANPLAKELYNGRGLSPGLIEPGLTISRPKEVNVLELLMSEKSGSHFALVRPLNTS